MKHILHKKIENCFIVKERRIISYMNYKNTYVIRVITQLAFTCSKSTSKAPEQGAKYVQSSK